MASVKHKRKYCTVSEKVQVIQYKKENPNFCMQAVAEKFDCGESQIQSILARRTEILDQYSANNTLSKRARASQTQNIDEATYDWYQKARI